MDNDGILAARKVRERHPGVGIVILTGYHRLLDDFGLAQESEPRAAYLGKDEATDGALVEYVRAVARGEARISQKSAHDLAHELRARTALEELTGTEYDVLQALAEGLTSKEIARRRRSSPHTVEKHVQSINAKLGLAKAGRDLRTLAVRAFLEHAPPEAPPVGRRTRPRSR